jgi:hypothetical protein
MQDQFVDRAVRAAAKFDAESLALDDGEDPILVGAQSLGRLVCGGEREKIANCVSLVTGKPASTSRRP